MELYIHIGSQKTGSTSIQKFLLSNRDELIKNRILFPKHGFRFRKQVNRANGTSGHEDWVDLLKGSGGSTRYRKREKLVSLINDTISDANDLGCDKVLLSSELFFSNSKFLNNESLKLLKKYFSSVKIIVFLRYQPDYIWSLFKEKLTWFRSNHTESFTDFCKSSLHNGIFDYIAILQKFESVVHKEDFFIFSYSEHKNNVISPLLNSLSVCSNFHHSISNEVVYPSLPDRFVPFFLEMNRNNCISQKDRIFLKSIFFYLNSVFNIQNQRSEDLGIDGNPCNFDLKAFEISNFEISQKYPHAESIKNLCFEQKYNSWHCFPTIAVLRFLIFFVCIKNKLLGQK